MSGVRDREYGEWVCGVRDGEYDEWTRKVEIRTRKKFLVVGEACVAIF